MKPVLGIVVGALILSMGPGRACSDPATYGMLRAALSGDSAAASWGWPRGTRVRLTPRDGRTPLMGSIESVSSDSLRFLNDASEWPLHRSIAWSSLQTVERSAGRRGHSLPALLIGLGAGIGAGLLFTSGSHGALDIGGSIGRAGIVAGCGVCGLALGAMVGADSKTERWEPVPFPPPLEPRAENEDAAKGADGT